MNDKVNKLETKIIGNSLEKENNFESLLEKTRQELGTLAYSNPHKIPEKLEELKKIEIAKNLLNSGLEIEMIAKNTGLSIKEVENLKEI